MEHGIWLNMTVRIKSPPNTETFWLPPEWMLKRLKVGDIVKFIFEEDGKIPERMWSIIQETYDDILVCTLDNAPLSLSIDIGHRFVTKKQNVIEIWMNQS
jgi:hypothetical protein